MLTNQEFILLRDFVYEKTGIYFAENKVYLLESRLAARLDELGLSSFEEYHYYLKYGGQKTEQELISLFDLVTTNETSFFRNPPQLDAFKMIVQKNYLNGCWPDGGLKIWSAGCSTGEEPYTLAILMLELSAADGQAPAFYDFRDGHKHEGAGIREKGDLQPTTASGIRTRACCTSISRRKKACMH